MRNRKQDPIQISEAELLRATADLDEFHHETFPGFRRDLRDWAESSRPEPRNAVSRLASRRTFLMGGSAAAVGGLVLSACGSSKKKVTSTGTTAAPDTTGNSTSTSIAVAPNTGDAAIAGTAASLENLAVAAYAMGIQAATAGKLGTVPPAVVTFATTAKMQHTAHAAAFNATLTASGQPAVTKPDPVVLPSVLAAFSKVKTVPELAMLALELENVAANTYMSDLGMDITDSKLIAALATIQPVERQHVSILYFVLGQYPVPETFQSPSVPAADPARPPSDISG